MPEAQAKAIIEAQSKEHDDAEQVHPEA
jgi:hypothetical protein